MCGMTQEMIALPNQKGYRRDLLCHVLSIHNHRGFNSRGDAPENQRRQQQQNGPQHQLHAGAGHLHIVVDLLRGGDSFQTLFAKNAFVHVLPLFKAFTVKYIAFHFSMASYCLWNFSTALISA